MNIENLELASYNSRILAFIIDDFLVSFIIVIIYWDIIATSGTDFKSINATMAQLLYPIFLLKFSYQTFFVWYYGATIGKIVAKKVIDYNNFERVSLFSASMRAIFRIVSEIFLYIGFIFAFFIQSRQTFHDKIANTLVINA
jgi:uncharacterized RDD family membrane protein YckC